MKIHFVRFNIVFVLTAVYFICSSCGLFTKRSSSICIESNKWKYSDYSQKPLFPNEVFAKGFSVYFNFVGKNTRIYNEEKEIKQSILQAFQVAITNWGVSLMINNNVDSSIKNYIQNYSFKQGNNFLYNAPIVFSVDCPGDANFILNIYFPGGNKFPGGKELLGKSQIKGRTIFINMHDYQMVYNQRLFSIKDASGNLNIVPILLHELGHSFGLIHNNVKKSIMSPALDVMSNIPTPADGLLFSKILLTINKGSVAGVFIPTECVGLRLTQN
jgi:predicted Zn-dependent protease